MPFPASPINGQVFVTPDNRSYTFASADNTWTFSTSSTTPITQYLWATFTAAHNAVSGEGLLLNSAGGVFTVTLPAAPATNEHIAFIDIGGVAATNNITVARNTHTIMGLAQDLLINTNNAHFQLIYTGTDWRIL